MNNDLLIRMKKVKNNLEYAKSELRTVRNILNESITLNNETFKNTKLSNLNTKLNNQIYILETKIISKIG